MIIPVTTTKETHSAKTLATSIATTGFFVTEIAAPTQKCDSVFDGSRVEELAVGPPTKESGSYVQAQTRARDKTFASS